MNVASVVTTTVDSADGAESLARGIVEARLGACVQIVPIRSVYRWDGEVRVDDEWQCVVKTSATRVDELVAHIKAHHSYDVPEVVVTPVVGGNEAYLDWVSEETS
ncbi:divalent cation transporter [Lentzea guizhouensis]|uniref:Divalent cation transporter n=1 Tax=Lentzea guizhouensis TaxID=1586287 RepID=A0A1B2HB76_9PSEU|nr:divalent-cation tolerance protein CutA [Lentzea guizhouensis]ANZ34974.1 divalent cation transporter [Lentzea guizhouensis]